MLWYRRSPATAEPKRPAKTRMLVFAPVPGVMPGAWPAFVGLGVVIGLTVQSLLVARAHLDVRATLAASLAGALAGLVGAKIWYLALHRHEQAGLPFEGLCIQGFLVGAVAAGGATLALLRVPIGPFLDATTPGLFLGMAIGRHGCFFGGCCAGRATASRWGLWTSDRRVGARRFPTQLMESLVCALIGFFALSWVLFASRPIAGVVFVAAIAAYTLARQILLPLRAEPRKTSIGRPLAMAAAASALVGDLALSILT